MRRSTIILAAMVVLLWGAWYLFRTGEKSELSVKERREFFQADSLAVDSIAVKYATWSYLTRRDGRWDVINPEWIHPADANIVRDVFKFTNEMVLENLISTRPVKHESFQVDTVRGTILRFFAQGQPAAEFVMGKSGADFNHTYIRRLGSDSVYMARGDFQRVFRRVPSDWATRILFDVDSVDVSRIRWITKESDTWIERDSSGQWLVYRDGMTSGLPVDTAVLKTRLQRMAPLRCDALALEGSGAVAETDNPHLQLIIDTKDGRSDTLLWNHPGENEQRMFAFRPGRPRPVFIFYKGSYDRMKGIFSDLVAKDSSRPAALP